VAALCLVPLSFTRLIGFFLAAGVLPGVAVAARSRFRLSECIGLGTALSPVVFGACVLAAMLAGAPVHTAAWVAVTVSCVLFVALAHGAGSGASDDAAEKRVLAGIALLVLLAAVMCFALPLAKLWWRARSIRGFTPP
jgi:Kef-type K+ transport system membrane component KefB